MAVGYIYRVAIKSRFGLGQDCVNVFHWKVAPSGSFIPDEPVMLADCIEEQIIPKLQLITSTSMPIVSMEIRQVFGGLASYDRAIDQPGLAAGEQTPPQCCPLTSWRTGLIGRANRGRTYWCAPPENFQSAGNLEASVIPTYQDLSDACLVLYEPVVGLVDYFNLCVFHTTDADSPNVITALVRTQIKTQRRRMLGVGS